MTDYLAEIAAMTVECPHIRKHSYMGEAICADCKNSNRVLDHRFEGLRTGHKGHIAMSATGMDEAACEVYECPGFTINRDLAVLLTCILPLDGAYEAVLSVLSNKELHRDMIKGKGDRFTEAASHAVYDWLISERQKLDITMDTPST